MVGVLTSSMSKPDEDSLEYLVKAKKNVIRLGKDFRSVIDDSINEQELVNMLTNGDLSLWGLTGYRSKEKLDETLGFDSKEVVTSLLDSGVGKELYGLIHSFSFETASTLGLVDQGFLKEGVKTKRDVSGRVASVLYTPDFVKNYLEKVIDFASASKDNDRFDRSIINNILWKDYDFIHSAKPLIKKNALTKYLKNTENVKYYFSIDDALKTGLLIKSNNEIQSADGVRVKQNKYVKHARYSPANDHTQSTRILTNCELVGAVANYVCEGKKGTKDSQDKISATIHLVSNLISNSGTPKLANYMHDVFGESKNKVGYVSNGTLIPLDCDKIKRVVNCIAGQKGINQMYDSALTMYFLAGIVEDDTELAKKLGDIEKLENIDYSALIESHARARKNGIYSKNGSLERVSVKMCDDFLFRHDSNNQDPKFISRLAEHEDLVTFGLAVSKNDKEFKTLLEGGRSAQYNEFKAELKKLGPKFKNDYRNAVKVYERQISSLIDQVSKTAKLAGVKVDNDFIFAVLSQTNYNGTDVKRAVLGSDFKEDMNNKEFTQKVGEKYGSIATILFENGKPRVNYVVKNDKLIITPHYLIRQVEGYNSHK